MSNYKQDVIFIGSSCCDIIFTGLPSMPKLGEEIWAKQLEVTVGGMMNSAAAASRLGLNVGLAAEIGDDLWGNIIVSKMKEEGIDLRYVHRYDEPYPQITVALNYREDRAFVSYADDRHLSRHLRHLHQVVSSSEARLYHFSARKEYAELIATAKRLNKTVSLDTSWDEEWLQSAELKAMIGLADIFMPNLKEAQRITGKHDPDEALAELAALCPVTVIKLGERGAIGQSDGKRYAAEAPQADVVDSTGAGDCFAAGFLYGWLQGRHMADCLRIANYCGSKSVEAVGGYTGAPSREQLLKALNGL